MSPQFAALRAPDACPSRVKHLNGLKQNTERADTPGSSCSAPRMSAWVKRRCAATMLAFTSAEWS